MFWCPLAEKFRIIIQMRTVLESEFIIVGNNSITEMKEKTDVSFVPFDAEWCEMHEKAL